MKRRGFNGIVAAGLSGIAAPSMILAQTRQKPIRLAFLSSYSRAGGRDLIQCFTKGLSKFGWVDGQSISIDFEWAEGRPDRFDALAEQIVRSKPDVIACNSTLSAQALHRNATTIPVVFMSVSDPVASGIVQSLARPGANITGVSNSTPATAGKLLELLRSLAPTIKRVGMLFYPDPGKELDLAEIRKAATPSNLEVVPFRAKTREEIEAAFAPSSLPDAMIVTFGPSTLANRERIVALAADRRLTAIYQAREFVQLGGLMSYGLNACSHYQQAAAYVDKIIKGAKPADLPVELPTSFEFVLNLKTAKTLGLDVPPLLIARADDVIE